jgi:hypothetical protein
MLFSIQINLFDIIYQFVPSIDMSIYIISFLFSITIVSIGPIIHFATKKILETLGKNAGPISAVAGISNVALNVYNTVQNSTDKSSGGSSSSSPPRGGEDNSKKDEDKVKKDDSKPESNDKPTSS